MNGGGKNQLIFVRKQADSQLEVHFSVCGCNSHPPKKNKKNSTQYFRLKYIFAQTLERENFVLRLT
jgi:hypothetical protein